MKLFTVVNENEGTLVYGSPKYPMWISDEPDIFVCGKEYSDEEYNAIRYQADRWAIEVRVDSEDDHGYSQVSSDTTRRLIEISDARILVKDGAFFGIIETMYKDSYPYHRVYASVNTADAGHGLWQSHYGYSSDNGTCYDDTILYLRHIN